MATSKIEKPKGVLNPRESQRNFSLARYLPTHDLVFFVEHYWATRWDLRGQAPYLAEVLSYPSVHMVIEAGRSGIFGVATGKFTRLLEGEGQGFAIRFRPGAFYPFVKSAISHLTNSAIPLSDAFGAVGTSLEQTILVAHTDEARIEIAERFLRERLPEQDPTIDMINQVIDRIRDDRRMTKVDDVVVELGLNKRTLQRIFSQYVGVSPKWVIQRYRLQEAADQLATGVADVSRLAADLGYFDQAHFIKDFKAIVGKSPMEYARQVNL